MLVSASLWTNSVIVQLAIGPLLGLMIARLFILGHDACHVTLFGSGRTNPLIGRLLFLPSLTPFLWGSGHNVAHHGYTNLVGFDYVSAPLRKDEFDRLSPGRRALKRLPRNASESRLYLPNRVVVRRSSTSLQSVMSVHGIGCTTWTPFW